MPSSPESTSTPDPGERAVEDTAALRRFTKKQKLIAGISAAALLLFIGGGIAMSNMNGPDKSPVAEATADPGEVPASPEEQDPDVETPESPETITVESLEIPAGLDAETLGTTLIQDRLTQWINAGADRATMDKWYAFNGTVEEFLPTIVGPNAEAFAEALCAPDSQIDTDTEMFISGTTKTNTSVLDWYITTVDSEKSENTEAYRHWITVDSVNETANSGGSRTLIVDFTEHNNADKNTADPLRVANGTYTITLEEMGGTEKIVSISVN